MAVRDSPHKYERGATGQQGGGARRPAGHWAGLFKPVICYLIPRAVCGVLSLTATQCPAAAVSWGRRHPSVSV